MPCRDAAAFLSQAIRGLSAQTFGDFEVVAVNDGSSDATGEILERWAETDPRVRPLHLEDGSGLPVALQRGVEACRGELLARVDADDIVNPRRLAAQVERFDRGDIAALGTRVRYFPSDRVGWGARRYERWLNALIEPHQLARDIYVECPVAHPTLMVSRDALETAGGYRANGWPEDYDLLLRLHATGARIANVPYLLHYWREGRDRASRVHPRYQPDAFRRCKLHHLRQGPLEPDRPVAIWGAGRVGKAFGRTVLEAGLALESFYDIDPGKIGQLVYNIPIRDTAELTGPGEAYLLVAVGAPGARALIRDQLGRRGFREPEHYRCVA